MESGGTCRVTSFRGRCVILLILLFPIVNLTGCGGSDVTGGYDSIFYNDAVKPVSLAWDAPSTNEDGSSLNDLAGYIVYYGLSSRNYTASVDVSTFTSCEISQLSPNTYYFTVSAYDTSGNESDYSRELVVVVN